MATRSKPPLLASVTNPITTRKYNAISKKGSMALVRTGAVFWILDDITIVKRRPPGHRLRNSHCSTSGPGREGVGARFLHQKSRAEIFWGTGDRRRKIEEGRSQVAPRFALTADARMISVRHRSYATHSRQPRQVRKEATVTGSCVCSESPVPGLSIPQFPSWNHSSHPFRKLYTPLTKELRKNPLLGTSKEKARG